MTLKIIHKNNTSAGQAPAPSDLDIGEIAVNSADAKLYTKDNDSAIQGFPNEADINSSITTATTFTQSGADAVARTFVSKLKDFVSVKDFGATGDGTTDDTVAIRAASSALSDNSALYFPPGNYIVSRSGSDNLIDLDSISNVVIYGKGAKITCSHNLSTGTFVIFRLFNAKKVKISGLEIDYEVNNVTGCTGERAVLVKGDQPTTDTNMVEDLLIENCIFKLENVSDSNTWPVESVFGVSGPLPEGDDGYSPAYKLEGIYIRGDNNSNIRQAKNITCKNCVFDRMTARTFWMWNCQDVLFTGNTINNVGARRPQVRLIVKQRNMQVTNNTFYNNNTYSYEVTITLVRQTGGEETSSEALIANNMFWYGRGFGIDIAGFKGVAIANNMFRVNPDYNASNINSDDYGTAYHAISAGIKTSALDFLKNISVTGNVIDGGEKSVVFFETYSSYLAEISNITITGNSVLSCNGDSVRSSAVKLGLGCPITNSIVSSNSFSNCNEAIAIYQTKNMTISGNTIQSVDKTLSGMSIFGAYNPNLVISSNSFLSLNRAINSTSGTWPQGYYLVVTGTATDSGTLTGSTSGATATIASMGGSIFYNGDYTITLTSVTGTFVEGETVTASGASEAYTVIAYVPAAENIFITNNTFAENNLVVRNFGSQPVLAGNLFRSVTAIMETEGSGNRNNLIS